VGEYLRRWGYTPQKPVRKAYKQDPKAVAEVHADWAADWRFLATSDVLHSPDFVQSFAGMHLPREVIDKIYRHNAEAMFKGAWN